MSKNNPKNEEIPRTASKQSVDKALELLRRKSRKLTKRKIEEDENANKFERYCAASHIDKNSKKKYASLGFFNSYAMPEMLCALINSDWPAIQAMFPLLLKCYHGEPIAWRYAFLIHLCSPASDQFHFQEFIKMCIGTQPIDDQNLLEQLLALKIVKRK